VAFPRRFQRLLETTIGDVEAPDHAFLTYAVCACEKDSCGWGGWILEAVFSAEPDARGRSRALPSDDSQRCPVCGKLMFRTEVRFELKVADDQARATSDEVAAVEYED